MKPQLRKEIIEMCWEDGHIDGKENIVIEEGKKAGYTYCEICDKETFHKVHRVKENGVEKATVTECSQCHDIYNTTGDDE